MDTMSYQTTPPVAYSITSLAAATDVSRQTIYREIKSGNLKAKRVRGRLVIPSEAVAEWLSTA